MAAGSPDAGPTNAGTMGAMRIPGDVLLLILLYALAPAYGTGLDARGADRVGSSPLAAYTCTASFARGAYELHWRLERAAECAAAQHTEDELCDGARREVHLALQIQLRGDAAIQARELGWWAGFGLAEAGGMRGADMFRFEANTTTTQLVDTHTTTTPRMLRDESQDWRLTVPARTRWSASDGAAFGATIEVARRLTTTDTLFDRPFAFDAQLPFLPTRVVGQWGAGAYDPDAPLGTVRAQLRLHAPACTVDSLSEVRADPEVVRVRVQKRGYLVSPKRLKDNASATTVYHTGCFELATLPGQNRSLHMLGRGAHIIAVEPVFKPAWHRQFIHHMTLFGRHRPCAPVGNRSGMWFQNAAPATPVYAWAAGHEGLVLPPEAGFRIGGPAFGGILSFDLQVHYELTADAFRPQPGTDDGAPGAPEGEPRFVDYSGFLLHVTPRLRRYDAGFLSSADPIDSLKPRPMPIGCPEYTYTCGAQCTRSDMAVGLAAGERARLGFAQELPKPLGSINATASGPRIFVFMHILHMHFTGERMQYSQWRADGTLVREQAVRGCGAARRGERLAARCGRPTLRGVSLTSRRAAHPADRLLRRRRRTDIPAPLCGRWVHHRRGRLVRRSVHVPQRAT